jgi:hypothetical protein
MRVSILTNLEWLRRVLIFSALTPAQIAEFSVAETMQRVKRGDLIVE